MIRKIERLVLVAVFLVISFCVSAQDGTYGAYSPYSIYGIGDIAKEGTAFNKSMGGVGIATRNRKFINITNPAAVTARDSLSFMADFGLDAHNTVFRQGDLRSAHNTFNIYDFVMTFPIYRSSAFMVGLTPFSNVGYDFSSVETDPGIIGNTGNIEYDSYGNGSVYQAFVGAGVTLWKNLSVGAEAIYYFGNLDKITNMNFSDESYISLNSGSDLGNLGGADVLGDVDLVEEHVLGAVVVPLDLDDALVDVLGDAVNVLGADADQIEEIAQGPVDGTGVHIVEAQLLGQSLGDGAFACTGRAVNGNRNILSHVILSFILRCSASWSGRRFPVPQLP